MKHKALIGFELSEYPEVKIFENYFECDFCEYSESFIKSNIEKYTILVPHLYIKISKEILRKGINLKYIFTPSTGTNHLDLSAIGNTSIQVFSLSDNADFIDNISSTAELAWMHILAANRKLLQLSNRALYEDSWKNNDIRGKQLKNQKLGIIGFGRLGKKVYKYAKAFEMEVLIYDIDASKIMGFESESTTLETLFSESDIITLHPKLNESSFELINKNTIRQMKDGVIIVNTARGDIIRSSDLIEALESGKVKFAGLDVLQNEFSSGSSPKDDLLRFAQQKGNISKILITPHAGGSTHDAHDLVFKFIAKSLNNLIK